MLNTTEVNAKLKVVAACIFCYHQQIVTICPSEHGLKALKNLHKKTSTISLPIKLVSGVVCPCKATYLYVQFLGEAHSVVTSTGQKYILNNGKKVAFTLI